MAQAPITVGTMNFGARTPEPEARRIVDRALERGITLFDTANVYGNGDSEKILGNALKGRREKARIATKVGANGSEGLSKPRVLAAIDESLKRLQTEFVDLYYLHLPDPKTPIAQTLEAVHALLESGKVKTWGISNYASWQILEMNALCDAQHLARPQVSQVLYNVLVRQLDVEYFAFTRAHPIHTTIFNPLCGGMLAGGKRGDRNPMYAKRYWNASLFTLVAQYEKLAAANGLDIVTLAYAWVAGRAGVDTVLSGPGSLAHLDAAIDGCAKELSPELRTQIDDIHRAYLGTDAKYAR
jgi:aryl-alcohol dehydrogenase-like predicted oxidoreductase